MPEAGGGSGVGGDAAPTRSIRWPGIEVGAVGLGTWALSDRNWWTVPDERDGCRLLRHALDRGVNLIDTAEGYGGGEAERLVGRAIAGRRDDVVVSSKVSHVNLEPHRLIAAFEASCARLQVERIDLYFIHWPRADLDIRPTLDVMADLRRAGRIGALGVSNFGAEDVARADAHCGVDVVQPPYNVFWRWIEGEYLAMCRARSIGVVTYSALALGLLAHPMPQRGDLGLRDLRVDTVLFADEIYDWCRTASDQLRQVAARAGRSLPSLAVGRLIAETGVTSVLVGCRTIAELDEVLDGVSVPLDPEVVAAVDDITVPVWEAVRHCDDMFGRWRTEGAARLGEF